MKRTCLSIVVICTALVFIAGCRATPIQNISDASISPASGTEPTLEQVTQAIIAAGTGPKPAWNMKVEKPGHIVATLFVRSHMAAVDITYTTKSYSITYNNSSNLKYKAEEGTIHSNYNGWIQNLNNAILNRLVLL